MNKLSDSSRNIIFVSTFASLFWGALQLSSPNYFLFDDNINMHLAFIRLNWDSVVMNFKIPFINFHEYLGQNYLGQGQPGVFSISLYIADALSMLFTGDHYWTEDFLMLIHLIAGGIGFYFLMRKLKISPELSTLSSMLWLTFPFMILISKAWFSVINIFPFLPWNLLFVLILFEAPSIRHSFYLGLVKALSFYSGNAQFVYMMAYTEAFFILFYFLSSNFYMKTALPSFDLSAAKNKLSTFMPMYIFSIISFLCLAAPQIFPLLASTGKSALRTDAFSVEKLILYNASPYLFIKAQSGQFDIHVFYNSKSVIYFVGLPLILIFLFLSRKVRDHENFKLSAALLLITSLAFLLGTKAYKYFIFLPLFDHFRWIFKHFLFFLFFFSILIATIGSSYLERNGLPWKKAVVYLVFIISIITNIYLNAYHGTGSRNALMPSPIDLKAGDPFKGIINKSGGRTVTVGYRGDFGRGKILNQNNSSRYLLFGLPTFWNYHHFNGYNPLVSVSNFHGGLGTYQRTAAYVNYLDLDKIDHYLEHISRWAGRYLITYNKEEVRDKINQYPQLVLMHESDSQLVYENMGAYPMVYYRSDISTPLKYEFGVNRLTIQTNNHDEDKLVINLPPIDGYSYRIDDGEYHDIRAEDINIKAFTISCDSNVENCSDIPTPRTGEAYIEEIGSKIKPVLIPLPPNTKSVILRYRDDNFYYGVYTLIVYISLLWGVTALIKARKKGEKA